MFFVQFVPCLSVKSINCQYFLNQWQQDKSLYFPDGTGRLESDLLPVQQKQAEDSGSNLFYFVAESLLCFISA